MQVETATSGMLAAQTTGRPWRGIVAAYRAVEATWWGRLLLGNLWPAYFFLLFVVAHAWTLVARIGGGALASGSSRLMAQTAQDAATTVFLALTVVLFLVRRAPVGDRATAWGTVAALVGTFLLNVVSFLPASAPPSTGQLAASTGVIVVGTVFTTVALAALGRCFGLLPEVRGLVTRGPYARVRHPVYLGELTSAMGLLIARPSILTVLLLAIFVAVQLRRITFEERALARAFPDAYAAYRERTGMLLPRWR